MRDLRPWTYAALYGALWGALEATAGTALHLGRVPMRGELMGLIGMVCLVCLRRLQPRPGVVLVAGATAVFLKVFTLGGLYPGPLVGIATQAIAVELGFVVARGPLGAAIGGAIALGTNPVQRVVTAWIVGGSEAATAVLRAVGELGGLRPEWVLVAFVTLAASVGAAGGVASWRLAGRVARRLGERS
ncbi:MAG: hypothetical protein MUC56_07130 [Thermoanaerobaculales bacterium]|nr:hypothetical protein [Thermoanaerobaculales bacterium]